MSLSRYEGRGTRGDGRGREERGEEASSCAELNIPSSLGSGRAHTKYLYDTIGSALPFAGPLELSGRDAGRGGSPEGGRIKLEQGREGVW